jgi:shikimate kinase
MRNIAMPTEQSLQIDKTIVLVGLMGCGKSSVGRRLARFLNVPFTDLDNKIESIANMSITEIFAQHGESYFRQLELDTIKNLLDGSPMILATGGGTFINEEIRNIIKENAISIWIKADLATLLERVSRKNTRPLLEKGNKKEILKDLMDKRYPIYEQADITVETCDNSHDIVRKRIIEALNERA